MGDVRPMIRSLFPMAASCQLEDAGTYITKLPKAKHEAAEWLAAMEALILAAERGGPTLLAWIGVMRALSCHVERVFESSVKKSIFAGVASACLPVLCDFVEAGPESPVHAKWARATGSSPGRAFVANCAGSPAIDDTSPVGCAMAARAASIGGLGRAED
jgi:hypothetical protein